MSNFNQCPNCGHSNTAVMGLKDPLYQCESCGEKCCPKCRVGDNICPHCAEKALKKIGLIK